MLALTMLFAAAGIFALASIVREWRRHGAQAFALRGELQRAPLMREFRFTVTELKVLRTGAQVHVLPVRRAVAAPRQLRAAA